jgi:hypothetical protein
MDGSDQIDRTKTMWSRLLRSQIPVTPDPKFPDRPRSGFFDLLSRITRSNDDVSEQNPEALVELIGVVGGDLESLRYMSVQRALRLFRTGAISRRLREHEYIRTDVIDIFVGAWIDAFITGALYGNQKPTIGHTILDDEENDDDADQR